MAKTKRTGRRPTRHKPRRRPVLWIAAGGVCVLLGALVWLSVWKSASSTAAGNATPSVNIAPAQPTESARPQPSEPHVPRYGYKAIRSYPHDIENFTQGFVYDDGFLYEGTGLYGRSALIKRSFHVEVADPNDPNGGAKPQAEDDGLFKRIRLPDQYFGEGVTVFGDKVIQLTWQSRIGFVYDKETLRQIDTFRYNSQGWGLTHDGKRLILSDGTATIRFLDPNTYAETGRLRVHDRGHPIRHINELQYIDGQIYANIWPTDYIAIICAESGRVTGWIDLTGLYTPPSNDNEIVANGITYLPQTQRLLVTGKRWPQMFEIELVPQPDGTQ